MGGRRTELVESLVGDGGHGEPHCRVVAQHGVEVFNGQRVDVTVRLRLDAGRPTIIRQQTDLCMYTFAPTQRGRNSLYVKFSQQNS